MNPKQTVALLGPDSLGIHFFRQIKHTPEGSIVDFHRHYLYDLVRVVAGRLGWRTRARNEQAKWLCPHSEGVPFDACQVHADNKAIQAAVGIDRRPPLVWSAEATEMDPRQLEGELAQLTFQSFEVTERVVHTVVCRLLTKPVCLGLQTLYLVHQAQDHSHALKVDVAGMVEVSMRRSVRIPSSLK